MPGRGAIIYQTLAEPANQSVSFEEVWSSALHRQMDEPRREHPGRGIIYRIPSTFFRNLEVSPLPGLFPAIWGGSRPDIIFADPKTGWMHVVPSSFFVGDEDDFAEEQSSILLVIIRRHARGF